MGHGPFFLMELVNPVLSGEGGWLTGDASARASEEAGVQSDMIRTLQTTFQLSQKLFLGLEGCMLSILVAVFSLADVLFICGRVGIVERRSQERHQFNCGPTSKFLFLTARLSLRQMWLLSLLRTCFQVSSMCLAMVFGGTETLRLTLNGKEWHSRSTSTRPNVREVSP